MSYIPYPNVTFQEKGLEYYPTYKKISRAVICGLCFAVPLCVAIPNSPLLKLSQTQDNKRALIPRMMTDFFYVNFIASSLSYFCINEYFITNDSAKNSFFPYLGPLTAQIPSWSCLFASHLFYPGMWAVFNESTWKERRREFVRLNTKCFFAFSNIHIPATIALGVAVGVLLYPFKYYKLRGKKEE